METFDFSIGDIEVKLSYEVTIIVEFTLEKKQHLLLQALLQGEDGLAFVRCVHGVQQLWTTSSQIDALKDWLKCLPKSFNLCILQEYVWMGE